MAKDDFGGVSEQHKASLHRLEDAQVLLDRGRWRGAMYLAGYSVECTLKVKLMRMFGCVHLSDLEELLHEKQLMPHRNTIFTHELEDLLSLAQARDRLRRDPEATRAFGVANRWMPAWRYTADLSNRHDAESFIRAITTLRSWIENNI